MTVDFGPTALMRCKQLGREPDELDGVLLTHLHGDHIGGLALLLIDLQYRAGRTRPFTIAGPPGFRGRVGELVRCAFPSLQEGGLRYPLHLVQTEVPGTVEVLGRSLTAIRALHDQHAVASSFVLDDGERRLAFSGDTGWQPALAELVRGADVFVCECSGVEAGYWAHLSLAELRAARDQIEVGRFVLSHLSVESRRAALEQAAGLGAMVADDDLVLEV